MSILTSNTNVQPPQPTKAELLNRKVKAIKEFSKNSYQQLTKIQQQGIELLWSDGRFTAQEIIGALGDEALKVFQMHGILTTAITDIATVDGITPGIALPTNAFEIVDGAIVVSEDPYTI